MLLASLVSGALLAGASLPSCFGPCVFVGLVPLLRSLVRGPSLRVAFRNGWLVGVLFFGVGFGWVFQAEVDGGLALPFVYAVAIPVVASGLGLFATAVAWLARRSPGLALGAAPALWVAIEFARSQEWLLAIPWNHLGYAIAEWPFLVQGASLVGVYGLSAWIVAVNAGLVLMPRLSLRARLALVVALAAPLAPGLGALGARGVAEPDVDSLRVAAVQPALEERERHVPDRLQANLRRLLALTAPLPAQGADLIAWPESAWERALGAAGDAFLAVIAHDLETPLLTGSFRVRRSTLREAGAGGRRTPGPPSWHNTAVLATSDGRTPVVAEKVHPVPVYERAPEGPLANALARAGLWPGRFGRGSESAPLLLPRGALSPAPIGVLVCIDASHPELARALRRAGARLLVALANEAGTGAWSAALHARVARLRAVENRVPVVRVANTGPTLWIDAHGRVVASLAEGEPASAAHALELAGAPPPYARIGDGAVVASCCFLALAMTAVRLFQPSWVGEESSR